MSEIDHIRSDIEALRVLMERFEGNDDKLLLQGVASVLADRNSRLAELERRAAE